MESSVLRRLCVCWDVSNFGGGQFRPPYFISKNNYHNHGENANMEVLLLKIRNEKDVTLKELSLRTGISKSALQRIESGEVSPTLEKLEIIAKVLGVRVTDLFKE